MWSMCGACDGGRSLANGAQYLASARRRGKLGRDALGSGGEVRPAEVDVEQPVGAAGCGARPGRSSPRGEQVLAAAAHPRLSARGARWSQPGVREGHDRMW